jgi:arylsulfatase A-like enzyme
MFAYAYTNQDGAKYPKQRNDKARIIGGDKLAPNSWPDGAMTPFRGEKNTNWEGAFRVPAMVRWPGHIKPGTVSNEIFSGLDWFPTLLAAAGDTTVKDRLLKGWDTNGRTCKVHLDGYTNSLI